MTYDLTPMDKATIVITLESTLKTVREHYEDAIDVGDNGSARACRERRDALYSAIRALEPDRPILPENREPALPRRFR
jgi:hypothetical protein